MPEDRSFMPICIDVSQARVVMIGGGHVALQKLKTICAFTRNVHVFAREVLAEIKNLNVSWTEGNYDPAQLTGAVLVYACTDDRQLNRRIGEEGRRAGALVNVADDPSECDFTSPAVYRNGDMTVAVSSNGRNARKSVQWRDSIKDFLEHDIVDR